MTGVLGRLGDRLLARLVPKTVASACEGPSAKVDWFQACYCGDPGTPYNCRWVGKICSTCGGITGCGKCGEAIGGNCCT